MQSKWHKPRKKLYLKETSVHKACIPLQQKELYRLICILHPSIDQILTECLHALDMIQPSMIREGAIQYCIVPSNVLSSTYFLGKTFFFFKFFLADPPSNFLEVCIKILAIN